MAALTDILHATANLHELSSILRVTSPQRLQAESLQCLCECIKILPSLLYERGDLSGLQLNAWNLRFGSDRSGFATGHHQQITAFDYSDSSMTQIEPLLLRLREGLMDPLLIHNAAHCSPKCVSRRINDGFHKVLDRGVDLASSDTSAGANHEIGSHRPCSAKSGGRATSTALSHIGLFGDSIAPIRSLVGSPLRQATLRSFLLSDGE